MILDGKGSAAFFQAGSLVLDFLFGFGWNVGPLIQVNGPARVSAALCTTPGATAAICRTPGATVGLCGSPGLTTALLSS
jgi:hypothetical protein